MALDAFSETWDDKSPQISKSWRAHGENLNIFFGYPSDIRKAIYQRPQRFHYADHIFTLQRFPRMDRQTFRLKLSAIVSARDGVR